MKSVQSVSALTAMDVSAVFEANLRGVATWSSAVVANNTTAGGPVVVAHDLGTVPTEISVSAWQDCRWWADASDRRAWTIRTIVFHASAEGRYTVRAGVI